MVVAPGVDQALAARRDLQRAARHQHRRAIVASAVPGVLIGVVVAVVLGALVTPAAAVVGVVVAAAAAVIVWERAPHRLLRALDARPLAFHDAPRAHVMVEGLCATMGLASPRLAVVDSAVVDAVTVGTRPATTTVVLTSGLLRAFGPVELEGALAHELSHVKHGDVPFATVVAAELLPWARWIDGGAVLRRLRGRDLEWATDRRSVGVTRYPPGLRAALGAMAAAAEADGGRLADSAVGRCTRWLWTAPLGPAITGDQLIGALDVTSVRVDALDEL